MGHPTVPLPKAYTFKSTCKKCQTMLGEKFSKLGPSTVVCTFEDVGEATKLTIKNKVNPEKVVKTTGQEQLSCEDHETTTNEKVETAPQIEKENNNANDNDNNQEQVCKRVLKGFEGIELHQLAKTKGLTQLELTQNLKMTFSDEKQIDSGKECDNKEVSSVCIQGDQNCFGTNNASSPHESKAKDVNKSGINANSLHELKAKDVNKYGELDLMQLILNSFGVVGIFFILILTYKIFKGLD